MRIYLTINAKGQRVYKAISTTNHAGEGFTMGAAAIDCYAKIRQAGAL
jgi:hypothetical protein